jgi:hypothetical protein
VNRLFAVAGQLLENGATSWIGEGAEHGIGMSQLHTETITIWLWFVKREEAEL